MTHGRSRMSLCEKGQWSPWVPVLKAEKWETEKPSKRRRTGLKHPQNRSSFFQQGLWYILDMVKKCCSRMAFPHWIYERTSIVSFCNSALTSALHFQLNKKGKQARWKRLDSVCLLLPKVISFSSGKRLAVIHVLFTSIQINACSFQQCLDCSTKVSSQAFCSQHVQRIGICRVPRSDAISKRMHTKLQSSTSRALF